MAGAAIEFSEAGEAAKINYDVPLPGAHSGRRVVAVELNEQGEVFTAGAEKAGEELRTQAGVSEADNGVVTVDEFRARSFFIKKMRESGVVVDEAQIGVEQMIDVTALSAEMTTSSTSSSPVGAIYAEYMTSLKQGIVAVPSARWGGKPIILLPLQPKEKPKPSPQLFLVEHYGISSFLGDYGMGRTVKTFTLLPGESTTISLKTWQSSRESIESSSSIVDSHEESARERFANTVQNETTDKATRSSTEKWHVEAEVEASWGFGSAKVSGGGSGEYHSGREQFAKQASEAIGEHAAEASSKRQLSVSSSSERSAEAGAESVSERTIANANMRRVLNFVFRELNQVYTTKLHLKEVRVGYTNGRLNSWREVPLSGMLELLEEVVRPDQREAVAKKLLKAAGIVFDLDDTAVIALERVTIAADGGTGKMEPAALDKDGEFPPPTARSYYRFRRGALAQDKPKQSNPVNGVLMSEQTIVMRTDSVIVEALLGKADALDPFAMEMQKAAAAERTLANEREQLLHETLRAVNDPERRAELAAALFGPPPADEQ